MTSNKGSNEKAQSSKQDKNYRLSDDTAALIDAIRNEGAYNRREESSEDKGKKLLEIITIFILVLTLIALYKTYVAISDQVAEMQKVYPEIHQSAQAAADQSASIIASERGRLFAIPTGLNRNGEKDPSPRVPYKIFNIGRTTVLMTGIVAQCKAIVNGRPLPVYDVKHLSTALQPIPPSIAIDAPFECIVDPPLTGDELAALNAKKEAILFMGYISYQDVFGKRWKKKFALFGYGDGKFFTAVRPSIDDNAEEEER